MKSKLLAGAAVTAVASRGRDIPGAAAPSHGGAPAAVRVREGGARGFRPADDRWAPCGDTPGGLVIAVNATTRAQVRAAPRALTR